ncbi:MAG: hypothetical protein QOI76_3372 [Frankiales bacterium]|jgi:hypothetical protein|nr:hypothetical protein [Frankiales bacterium]
MTPAPAVEASVIELPHPKALAVRVGRTVVESTLIPLGLFYGCMASMGLVGAVMTALAWTYAGIARRLVKGQPIPGMLLIGALLMTARTIIALMTGSVFLYFLQPTLGTFLVAALFLISAPLGKPLTQKVATDFCPIEESIIKHPGMASFFGRISLMWGIVYTTNGAATLWLLFDGHSVGIFLLMKAIISATVTWMTVGASYLFLRRTMRATGISLRWGRRLVASAG